MSGKKEALVYWLDPWLWDKEMELVALHEVHDPVERWLAMLRAQGWKVMLLPYDARISGGPCDGGHVVAVETGEGRQFAALPPAAIPALRSEIPATDYQALLRATPALHGGISKERIP
ncbi:MAG: hypothetical protein ACRDGS_05600 [Chloroflexota bacterium]